MRRLLFALLCFASTTLFAASLEGVAFADKEKVGTGDAVLNGAGIRNKLFFKVYVVGLYLPQKAATAGDAMAQKGAKRLHIVTLRDLTAEQLADALVQGVERNAGDADMAPLRDRLAELRTTMLSVKQAPKGATILLDWTPENGTRLMFNDKQVGKDIPGEDFYRAILKIWLGDHPAQDNLKEALLGKPQ